MNDMRRFQFSIILIVLLLLFSSCGNSFSVSTDIDTDDELLLYFSGSPDYTVYYDDIGEILSDEEDLPLTDTENKESYSGIKADVESVPLSYILNTNTKKYHLPGCSSVKDIKPNNYSENSDISFIMGAGYIPCKKCNP